MHVALIRENEQPIDGYFACSMILRLVTGSMICLFKEPYFTLLAFTFIQTKIWATKESIERKTKARQWVMQL